MEITAKRRSFHAFQVDVLNLKDAHPKDVIWETLTASEQYSGGVSKVRGTHPASGYRTEIRNTQTRKSDPGIFMGAVCKCREDAPPLRRPDGAEVLQALRAGETLLEKNFFLYSRDDRVLIWQTNPTANGYTAFARMLGAMCGDRHTFAVYPVTLSKEDITKDSQIEVVDFRVVAPNAKAARRALMAQDPTDWGVMNPFQVMGQAEAKQMEAKIKTARRKSMGERALKFVTALTATEQIRRLRVKLVDIDEPIDLLTTRFKAKEEVEFNGHHLDRSSMYAALWRVWTSYCARAGENC